LGDTFIDFNVKLWESLKDMHLNHQHLLLL
jgi:hypothetical protein